jgi:serine/threonine-protein kinase RsbT
MGEPLVAEEALVPIRSETDIVTARQSGRQLALRLGFSSAHATLVATAISELARNILMYARSGTVLLQSVENANRCGMVIVAEDEGPGIADVSQAIQDGFSTSGRLGLGLPGVRRLMDDFDIESQSGEGTRVRVRKWIERSVR